MKKISINLYMKLMIFEFFSFRNYSYRKFYFLWEKNLNRKVFKFFSKIHNFQNGMKIQINDP